MKQTITFKFSFSLTLTGLLTFCFACTSSRFNSERNSESIKHIENNLFEITKSGGDTGTAFSIAERMKNYGVLGLSVAVFDNGKIIWSKGYGLRNVALNQPVDAATAFQAASISKPVTTVASMRLVNKGLLKLDENINTYLQRWKVPDNEFTTDTKVTLRRIISHTAGLSVHGFYGYNPDDTIPTIVEILDGIRPANNAPVRVFQKPGNGETYSGGGFTILQLAIEEVTGKTFPVAMDELVLLPAEMKNSQFSLRVPEQMKNNFATGYRKNGDTVDGGYHVYPEQAAAGLWTTPADLATFMLAVGDAYRKDGGLLPQATVKEMFTKIPGAGGLGFGIDRKGDSLRFRHSGGNEGFSCFAVSFAEIGRGAVIMTNSDNGSTLIREFLRAISKEYNWPLMWTKE